MIIKISDSTKQYLKNHLLLIHMINTYYQFGNRSENDPFANEYHIAQLESLKDLFRDLYYSKRENYYYGENSRMIFKFLYEVCEVTRCFHYERNINIEDKPLHIENILKDFLSRYGEFNDEIEFDFSIE